MCSAGSDRRSSSGVLKYLCLARSPSSMMSGHLQSCARSSGAPDTWQEITIMSPRMKFLSLVYTAGSTYGWPCYRDTNYNNDNMCNVPRSSPLGTESESMLERIPGPVMEKGLSGTATISLPKPVVQGTCMEDLDSSMAIADQASIILRRVLRVCGVMKAPTGTGTGTGTGQCRNDRAAAIIIILISMRQQSSSSSRQTSNCIRC